MKRVGLLVVLLLAVLVPAARADPVSDDAAFRCFPVIPTGFHPPIRFRGSAPRTRQYATALSWAASHAALPAAGHVLLVEIGCGAGCILLAAIDSRTGFVHWLPASISNWPVALIQPVRSRPDSRLVIISGQLDERGSAGPFRFLLDAAGFHRFPSGEACRSLRGSR